MPISIDHHEVRRLLAEEEAQLVEVLPAQEFGEEHIVGAVNIPLKELDARAPRDVAHRDVPTCGVGERLADVRERVRAAGWDTCVVVNEQRVVLGRLGHKALTSGADMSVDEAMTPGPRTVRPSIGTEALLERM